MSPESPAKPAKNGIPVWVLVVTLVAVAAIAAGTAWYFTSNAGDDETATQTESTATAEASDEETPAAEQAETPETPPATSTEPKPSYKRFAYIRAVNGSTGSWQASLDFFDILTGPEAEAYTSSHGIPMPSNGILYVDEDSATELVDVADDVAIRYSTGGVESLEWHDGTIEQLRDYVAGDADAMPGAYRDQWNITVVDGVITNIDMVVVAD